MRRRVVGLIPAGGLASAPPITAPEFARALDRLGPFEPAPHLALAVSGGADSMALAVLADAWSRARGGTATCLIVDHGLRPDSAAEAALVADRLRHLGLVAVILRRDGGAIGGDIQARARAARYRLLTGWCAGAQVLHLLTAHHLDDQAETLLLRLARGSGVNGLAAMPDMVESGTCRLIRPLLHIPSARLRATLAERGVAHVEDPSNANPLYARVRLRQASGDLAALGLNAPRLAETARQLAGARVALDLACDRLLAACVALHPAGFARLDLAPLAKAPADLVHRALAAILVTIGGADFPPRFERLTGLTQALLADPGLDRTRTLGGCRIERWRGGIIVAREVAAVAPPIRLAFGAANRVIWDRRFLVEATPEADMELGALGSKDMPGLRAVIAKPDLAMIDRDLPKSVWPSLPALRRNARLVSVPVLGWVATGENLRVDVNFRPARALSGYGFTVV